MVGLLDMYVVFLIMMNRNRHLFATHRIILLALLMVRASLSHCQYPFEKYAAISYVEHTNWVMYDRSEKEKKIHHTITVPKFFSNADTLTVQLTSFIGNWDSSYIRVYRNKKQIQRFFEPMGFSQSQIFEPMFTADINSDGLTDVKLLIPYMGCGLASLNVRVIYLFQKGNGSFTKISFNDMMSENNNSMAGNRPERDFDGDKNFEIITMTLKGYEGHNYWLFNLYDFVDGELNNVNVKDDYPIMIQFLIRENYTITDKLTRLKMKEFSMPLPERYNKQ